MPVGISAFSMRSRSFLPPHICFSFFRGQNGGAQPPGPMPNGVKSAKRVFLFSNRRDAALRRERGTGRLRYVRRFTGRRRGTFAAVPGAEGELLTGSALFQRPFALHLKLHVFVTEVRGSRSGRCAAVRGSAELRKEPLRKPPQCRICRFATARQPLNGAIAGCVPAGPYRHFVMRFVCGSPAAGGGLGLFPGKSVRRRGCFRLYGLPQKQSVRKQHGTGRRLRILQLFG